MIDHGLRDAMDQFSWLRLLVAVEIRGSVKRWTDALSSWGSAEACAAARPQIRGSRVDPNPDYALSPKAFFFQKTLDGIGGVAPLPAILDALGFQHQPVGVSVDRRSDVFQVFPSRGFRCR